MRHRLMVAALGPLLVFGVACGRSDYVPTGEPHLLKTRIEQRPDAVLIHVTNPNTRHELRDQRFSLMLWGPGKQYVVRGYHYGQVPDRAPGCCLIEHLPPQGEVTLRLPPVREKVGEVNMSFIDGGWIKT